MENHYFLDVHKELNGHFRYSYVKLPEGLVFPEGYHANMWEADIVDIVKSS